MAKVERDRTMTFGKGCNFGVFACPREKVQSRISSRLENGPLPLLSVFINHMQVDEVQINGGGPIMLCGVSPLASENRGY
jgi:hypothetical protein